MVLAKDLLVSFAPPGTLRGRNEMDVCRKEEEKDRENRGQKVQTERTDSWLSKIPRSTANPRSTSTTFGSEGPIARGISEFPEY